MSSYEPWGGTSAASRAREAEEIIARVQRLAETPRPPDGYPLDHVVEASRLGDLTAIATLSLRAKRY